MSYIGNAPRFTDNPIFQATATSGQTAFTLTWTPGSGNALIVFVNGVLQRPATDYSVSGTTLTFVSGVTLGYSVTAFGIGQLGSINTVADGTVSLAKLAGNSVDASKIVDGSITPSELSTGKPVWDSSGNVVISGTADLTLPKGTTAQRGTVETGKIRFNTDNSTYEGSVSGTSWLTIDSTIVTNNLNYFLGNI